MYKLNISYKHCKSLLKKSPKADYDNEDYTFEVNCISRGIQNVYLDYWSITYEYIQERNQWMPENCANKNRECSQKND